MADYDLVVRGGTIVDGSGAEPFVGDVGIRDGRIVQVGNVTGQADLAAYLADCHQSKYLFGGMLVWVLFYAGISRLLPQRQFLHDLVCGTRVIDHRDQLPV